MGFGGVGGSFGNNPEKGMSGYTRTIQTVTDPRYAPTAAPAVTPMAPVAAPPAPTGPGWPDISNLFREALASLSGEGEKAYQTGKRRTLADIGMQSVNTGMANTLNMPAAGIAYDEANRPAFNTMLGTQKANILTGLGQTAAGMYGVNTGAQTSRYGIDVGAQTSRYGTDVGAQTSRYGINVDAGTASAQQALQQYIAQLNNVTANRELSLKYPTGLSAAAQSLAGGSQYLSAPRA